MNANTSFPQRNAHTHKIPRTLGGTQVRSSVSIALLQKESQKKKFLQGRRVWGAGTVVTI